MPALRKIVSAEKRIAWLYRPALRQPSKDYATQVRMNLLA
jgi:hypothetical protein